MERFVRRLALASGERPAWRLVSSVPWALPVLVLLAGAGYERPPVPLALAGVGALTIGLGFAGLRVARLALPSAPAWTRATAALVFATLGAVLPALALGHFGALWPRPFLVAVALLVALVGAFSEWRPAAQAPPSPAEPAAPWRRALRAAAFAALAVGTAAALHAERHRAPDKLDDPSYHLTAVATWHHYGDLRTPKFGFGDPTTAFYPIGSEIVAWTLLAPLRDSDFVLRWSQLLYFFGTLAAAAAVARELGLAPPAAPIAVLLLATVPRAFPSVALSAGNDHSTAFFAVAAVAAALRLARRPAAGAAVFAGAAFGLLAGTKYLGLLLAAPLAGLLLVTVASPDPPAVRPRRRVALLLLAAAVAAVAGGYTYLRNAVSLDNPVFPVPVAIAGLELPGWEEATLAVRRERPEFRIDLPEFLLDVRAFGPLFPFTALPAALVAPLLALLFGGPWRRRLRRAAVFGLPAVFFLLFLFLVHDHRDIRYLFAAIALAAVGFAALVAAASRRRPWIAIAVEATVAVAVIVRFVRPDRLSPVGVVLALLAVAAAVALARPAGGPLRRRLRQAPARAAATLIVLAGFAAVSPELASYQRRKYANDLIVEALERRAPGGTVIAYAGYNRPYPYFGARLEHRVEQVPTRGPVDARYFNWGGEPSIPWRSGRYRAWHRNLRQLGVEHLILESRPDPEQRWAEVHPESFQLITFHGNRQLWRFEPSAGAPDTMQLDRRSVRIRAPSESNDRSESPHSPP